MRVAVGGFAHETNTFHPAPTTLEAFQRPPAVWVHGDSLIQTFTNTRSVIGGFLDVARERSWTVLIEVATPGITSPNASRFAYYHVRRPIFPLDEVEV